MNANELNIFILKSRLTGWDDAWSNAQKLTAFKAWMAENPVTVFAQMSTPASITPVATPPLSALPQLDRTVPRLNVVATDAPTLQGQTTLNHPYRNRTKWHQAILNG